MLTIWASFKKGWDHVGAVQTAETLCSLAHKHVSPKQVQQNQQEINTWSAYLCITPSFHRACHYCATVKAFQDNACVSASLKWLSTWPRREYSSSFDGSIWRVHQSAQSGSSQTGSQSAKKCSQSMFFKIKHLVPTGTLQQVENIKNNCNDLTT